MIKALFASEQQPVKIIRDNNKAYVFICLNGQQVSYDDENNETSDIIEGIEYDYNDFIIDIDKIDLSDVENNPEKYLNYPLPQITEIEQLRADVDYLLMLES